MRIRRLQFLRDSLPPATGPLHEELRGHWYCRDLVAGIGFASLGSMSSQVFEVLHRAFVVLRLFTRVEGAQVAALAGGRVLLP